MTTVRDPKATPEQAAPDEVFVVVNEHGGCMVGEEPHRTMASAEAMAHLTDQFSAVKWFGVRYVKAPRAAVGSQEEDEPTYLRGKITKLRAKLDAAFAEVDRLSARERELEAEPEYANKRGDNADNWMMTWRSEQKRAEAAEARVRELVNAILFELGEAEPGSTRHARLRAALEAK